MHDLERARPFCDWHEDIGDVLWWQIPIQEPPYLGSPLDAGAEFMVATSCFEVGTLKLHGWPFGDNPRNLWWTPLPDGKMIEDQVPL